MSRRLLPLLFLVVVGCGPKPAPDTTPEPEPPGPTPTTTAQPTVDPNAPTAEQTVTYWREVGKIQELTARKYAALADPKPEAVSPLLTEAAKAIDELPAEKVDPDAVAVGKGLAEELRQRADAKPTTPAAATLARTTKEALSKRYGREYPPLDVSAAEQPVFRIAHDLSRPTLTQELARLNERIAKFDTEIKPVNQKLSDETTTRDRLSGEAESVRAILKAQTSDAELKKLREEVLADAEKQLEASKKVIDKLTKEVTALRTQKNEYDRLATEVKAILNEGDPAEAEKLKPDQLFRLRTQVDRVVEKLDALKAKESTPEPGK